MYLRLAELYTRNWLNWEILGYVYFTPVKKKKYIKESAIHWLGAQTGSHPDREPPSWLVPFSTAHCTGPQRGLLEAGAGGAQRTRREEPSRSPTGAPTHSRRKDLTEGEKGAHSRIPELSLQVSMGLSSPGTSRKLSGFMQGRGTFTPSA